MYYSLTFPLYTAYFYIEEAIYVVNERSVTLTINVLRGGYLKQASAIR